MYGLNNNTGIAYSQANNNISQLNKKINNADKGSKTQNNLLSAIKAYNAFQNLKSDSGFNRLQAGVELAGMIAGAG